MATRADADTGDSLTVDPVPSHAGTEGRGGRELPAGPDPIARLRGDTAWADHLRALARDRLADVVLAGTGRRRVLGGVAVVAVLVAAVLGFVGGRGQPAPEPLPFTRARPTVGPAGTTPPGSSATRSASPGERGAAAGGAEHERAAGADAPRAPGSTPPTIWVDVTGAVRQPGLVALADGARLAEAITAAGGLAADADRDRVNLAGRVRDGERVYVPRRGEHAAPSVVAGAPADGGVATVPGGGDAGGAPTAPTTAPGPIDLNTATAAQLDTLPGIGPATAAAIIDYRTQKGPFQSVDELDQVRGLGAAKVEQLRPHVRVGA